MAPDPRELLKALEAVAYSVVCWGTCTPGKATKIGNITFQFPTGRYCVVEAWAYDALCEAMASARAEDAPREHEAFKVLEGGKLAEGSGPADSYYNEDDRELELSRGRWYVFDGAGVRQFQGLVEAIGPRGSRQRLEALSRAAEKAYGRMYEVHSPTSAGACYNEAKESLNEAIELAVRWNWDDEAAALRKRLDHITAVFRSQFS